MTLIEILKLKYPTEVKNNLIGVGDRGDGQEITCWNVDFSKPTQKTLEKWESELQLQYRQHQARESRKYPSIAEQLDMQYWDIVNGTTVWQDTISAIKEANPIPNE